MIDASETADSARVKLGSCLDTLNQPEVDPKRVILVLNKIDLLKDARRERENRGGSALQGFRVDQYFGGSRRRIAQAQKPDCRADSRAKARVIDRSGQRPFRCKTEVKDIGYGRQTARKTSILLSRRTIASLVGQGNRRGIRQGGGEDTRGVQQVLDDLLGCLRGIAGSVV